jgi:hypothetical protein
MHVLGSVNKLLNNVLSFVHDAVNKKPHGGGGIDAGSGSCNDVIDDEFP